ncbi:ATP-dependent RecD-like DNA helicase [Candidatus Babela massiliensis]|uniref:Helicase RecD/TraA family n=1 Tax=Candidatus Babela massiliensis TaxID=673862 RepID=V6DJ09_9BACT|nr:ATP-dependent RecD-like DNA helicase [Candidatus Babela massiliensis]CDK30913.1 helicase RecD/TraA family [Candidatus Babela massiliensis]
MQNLDQITGTVERFLFQDNESGFTIFVIQNKQTQITVSGYTPNIKIGQEVKITGSFIVHPKFGKQFKAQECISTMPNSLSGIKKYLGSGIIKGIGPAYADKLVNYFGQNILEVIDKNPTRLQEVNGIGPKKIEKIVSAWQEQKEIANIIVFLQEKNISCNIAVKIYKKYKQEAIAILSDNPYRLADEIWGIGFKTADEIAQKLGFDLLRKERIAAGINYTITTATQQGHLYIEIEELKEKTITLLNLEHIDNNQENIKQILKQAFYYLYEKDKIKVINYNNQNLITLSQYFFTEKNVSDKIKNIINYKSKLNFDIDKIYQKLRTSNESSKNNIELNEQQQLGIMGSFKNKVTVITGGPGTGKTTLIKKLLELLESENVNYKLAAPTGRATKRMIEGTGRYATTIHRLLDFDVSIMNFKHNENNTLNLDFLIIDEASMIDIFLANAILKAIPYNAHIVFIGDVDQLPSVGPGNVLNDLISSQKIAVTRLTQIFRQAQDSLIVINAHKINNGQYPVSNIENSKNDFIFIKEEDPENITSHLKKILFITLKKYNIAIDDSIVLTPMNRGTIGTYSLNSILQEMLNPNNTITTPGAHKFKVNDKVMQIRNNYDKKVYNGDIGKIEAIDLEERQIKVNFSDNIVLYEFEELDELVLAYSISIHKSQGSEYSCVIVPIFTQHFMLLQKNLIYTALTRAKKLCIFIGQTKALAIALKNNKTIKRVTLLKELLTDDLQID